MFFMQQTVKVKVSHNFDIAIQEFFQLYPEKHRQTMSDRGAKSWLLKSSAAIAQANGHKSVAYPRYPLP